MIEVGSVEQEGRGVVMDGKGSVMRVVFFFQAEDGIRDSP